MGVRTPASCTCASTQAHACSGDVAVGGPPAPPDTSNIMVEKARHSKSTVFFFFLQNVTSRAQDRA